MTVEVFPHRVYAGYVPFTQLESASHALTRMLMGPRKQGMTTTATRGTGMMGRKKRIVALTVRSSSDGSGGGRDGDGDGVSLVFDGATGVEMERVAGGGDGGGGGLGGIKLDSRTWRCLGVSEGACGGNVCLSVASLASVVADAGITIMAFSSFSGEFILYPNDDHALLLDALRASNLRAVIVGEGEVLDGDAIDFGLWGCGDEIIGGGDGDGVGIPCHRAEAEAEEGRGKRVLGVATEVDVRVGGMSSEWRPLVLEMALDALVFGNESVAFFSLLEFGGEISVVADAATMGRVDAQIGGLVGERRKDLVLRLWRDSWTAIHIAETLDLVETGIVASIACPLAEGGVHAMCYLSLFHTDLVLVRASQVKTARAALAPVYALSDVEVYSPSP